MVATEGRGMISNPTPEQTLRHWVGQMTNWQNTRYMREVSGIRNIKKRGQIAEKWAMTPHGKQVDDSR